MPVLNEERHISQTLQQLSEQDFPAELLEVIVADGGSTDRTRQLVQEAQSAVPFKLTLLDNPSRLAGAGRNLAVLQATNEYVLVVDGHVYIPSRQLLSDMACAARDRQAEVLGRPQPLCPPDINDFQAAVAAVRASPFGHSVESHIYGNKEGWVSPISVGVMYRRSLFQQFGCFGEDLDAVEDLEFNYRLEQAGKKAYISPRFTVYYYPRADFRSLFWHMYRYGLGRINFGRKHPERVHAEVYAPLAASAIFLLFFPALVLAPSARLTLLATATLAALLVTAVTAQHMGPRRARLWLAPICLLVIHLGLGFGVLRALLGRKSTGPLQSTPKLQSAQR
jgi:glycosyltransferase involved in cell wall biosynthesis